ncbi:MAG: 50S ribosomal protein L29 [Candidatus Paceibacterota bacterium]|jgi:ribosomal protein L29
MAKKKENFKEMEKEELFKKIAFFREEIRVIRFKAEGSKSKNVKESLNLKRQIARILTEINNK